MSAFRLTSYQHVTAEFYVYELVDPRVGETFYVGKGRGNRARQHLFPNEKNNQPKLARINEIRADGIEPEIRVVREFGDEQQAYDFEAQYIAEIGLDKLTNIRPGGGRGRFEVEARMLVKSFLIHDWRPLKDYPDDMKHWGVWIVEGIADLSQALLEKWGERARPLRDYTHERVYAYLEAEPICGFGYSWGETSGRLSPSLQE